MIQAIKKYLLQIEPYKDGYKCLIAYFLSLIGGKGLGLLAQATDPIMNYLVLAIGLTALIMANNTLKGSNSLFYWLGFGMIILNALSLKIMGVGMIVGISILMITSGVLKNLKLVEDVGGIK